MARAQYFGWRIPCLVESAGLGGIELDVSRCAELGILAPRRAHCCLALAEGSTGGSRSRDRQALELETHAIVGALGQAPLDDFVHRSMPPTLRPAAAKDVWPTVGSHVSPPPDLPPPATEPRGRAGPA
ncbi:MAG: hypothetical protein KJ792_08960 [Actinobacteria bacterium]|nr:hypothetical protein [Actinomycetota bacterium]MCG2803224.1 hypothetical protein [Cellulomonas sp.]